MCRRKAYSAVHSSISYDIQSSFEKNVASLRHLFVVKNRQVMQAEWALAKVRLIGQKNCLISIRQYRKKNSKMSRRVIDWNKSKIDLCDDFVTIKIGCHILTSRYHAADVVSARHNAGEAVATNFSPVLFPHTTDSLYVQAMPGVLLEGW